MNWLDWLQAAGSRPHRVELIYLTLTASLQIFQWISKHYLSRAAWNNKNECDHTRMHEEQYGLSAAASSAASAADSAVVSVLACGEECRKPHQLNRIARVALLFMRAIANINPRCTQMIIAIGVAWVKILRGPNSGTARILVREHQIKIFYKKLKYLI